jgi:hypothetical protein
MVHLRQEMMLAVGLTHFCAQINARAGKNEAIPPNR